MSDAFSEWQQEASKDRTSVQVCLDRALVSELEDATAELRKAQGDGMLDGAAELQERVDALRSEVEAKTRTLTFESIGRREWRKLLAEHPPTEQQKRDGADHNPETFPQAAIAASCIEPGLTTEQAEWLAAELPLMKFEEVWATCLAVNIKGADEKKAVASASLRLTEKRSRQPSSSKSHSASSAAE